jgi:hypothetical protein
MTERILFLGNSITLHGPKADIGWFNDCGMAASALEKDYVHLLFKSVSKITGKKPEVLVKNIVDFEKNYDTYDIDNSLKDCFGFKADLVIVAIGENIPSLISEESKIKFKASMVRLLTALKKNSDPVILVRSCFWPDKTKDEIMKQACAGLDGTYVDISGLSKDESNYARAERTFAHSGVGAHPGDKGMEVIAAALLDALIKKQRKK